jgi:membrane protein implicated in regulation of membrane protease activity
MPIRTLFVIIVMLTAALAGAGPASAMTVAAVDLIDDGESFSGQEVTVVGELVGDYGFRSDGSMWTQLNSDSYAIRPIVEGGPLRGSNTGIGIRMPAALARDLDPPGRYRLVGPVVAATGIWRYHDPQRQGESFLDVTSIALQAPGRDLSEHPNWSVYGAAFAFAVIAGVATIGYIRERDSV